MKAVNLIPADERRGAGGAGGRTAGGAYVLLGALALVVAMLAAYATTSKSSNDAKAQLALVERDAGAGEAKAAALAPYTAFAALRTARVATVKSIADSRFDWAHALHELGRTLPANITLTALTGSVSTSSAGGGGGGGVALRAAYDVPAIELNGCAPGQAAIPPMLTALRQVDGVRRVALQQSIKGADGAAAGVAGATVTQTRAPDCRRSFQAVIFFDPKPAPAPPAAAAPAPGAGATPGAGVTQNVNGGVK
jgi:Tfp pilus assembly protein PilN